MATVATESVTHNEIVRLMVGRDVAADLFPARANAHVGGAALVVRNLSWTGVLMTSIWKSGAAKS